MVYSVSFCFVYVFCVFCVLYVLLCVNVYTCMFFGVYACVCVSLFVKFDEIFCFVAILSKLFPFVFLSPPPPRSRLQTRPRTRSRLWRPAGLITCHRKNLATATAPHPFFTRALLHSTAATASEVTHVQLRAHVSILGHV